ncbi:hypothetical protein SLE2022_094330 [Rubroshorea leprosula]
MIHYQGINCLPLPPIPPLAIGARRHSFACCSLNINSGNADLLARLPQNTKQDTFRPLRTFPPDIWGDRFASFSVDNSELLESYSRKVESLKEIVGGSLIATKSSLLEKVNLINLLYRLGVSYHFENEIEEQLNHLFEISNELVKVHHHDLSSVALIFQVFRQHGYNIPCDVFSKFTDKNGKFKSKLGRDVKGILSLYEACQWGIQGEDILDEANAFTIDQLQSLAMQSRPHLRQYILDALNRPYHRGVPRVEHRQFISFYEQEESSRNDTLLNLAKFDFNRLQLLHQQELKLLARWWKDLNLMSMVNIRDRIAEVHLWSVAHYFEPQYSRARKILSQLFQLLGALDDTYDAYGTYEELRCLTHAMLRWDRSALDQLPTDPLKALYKAILDTHEEAEKEVAKEGRSFAVTYTKEETMKTLKTYTVQARWTMEDRLPTLDEYLEEAVNTSGANLLLAQACIGMEEAGIEAFEWIARGEGKTLHGMNVIGRLYNDIVSNEDEEKRGLVAGLNCYIEEHGVSREEAIEAFRGRFRNAWKELNEDWLMRPTIVPRKILLRAFNMARVVDLTYKDADGLTYSEQVLKDYILKLFVEPIPL